MEGTLPEFNSMASLSQVEAHLRRLVNEVSDADLEEAREYLPGQSDSLNNQKGLAALLRQERSNNHRYCWTQSLSNKAIDENDDKLKIEDKVNKLALETYLLIKNSMSDMGSRFDLVILARVSLQCLFKELDKFKHLSAGGIFTKRNKKRGKKRKSEEVDSDDSACNYNKAMPNTNGFIDTMQLEALCNLLAVTLDHMSCEDLAHNVLLTLVNKLLNLMHYVKHQIVSQIFECIKLFHRAKVNDEVSQNIYSLCLSLLKIASDKSEISISATNCLEMIVKGALLREDKKFVDLFYFSVVKIFESASAAIELGDKMMPYKHFLIALKSFAINNQCFLPHYLRIVLQISHLMLQNPPIFIIRESISTLIAMLRNLKPDNSSDDSRNYYLERGLPRNYYLESNIYPVVLTVSAATLKLGGKGLKLTNEDICNIYNLMSIVVNYLNLYTYNWSKLELDDEKDKYIYDKAVTRIPLNTDYKQVLAFTFTDTCTVLSKFIDGKTSQVDLSTHLSSIINSMPDELIQKNDCVNEYMKFVASLKNWVNISQSDMIYHNLIASLLSLSKRLPNNYFVDNKNEILDTNIPHLVERYKKSPSLALEELFCELARSYGLTQLLSATTNQECAQSLAGEVSTHFLYPIFEKGLKGMPLMYFVENIIPTIYSLYETLNPLQRIQEILLKPAEVLRKKTLLSALEQLYKLTLAFCRDPPDITDSLCFDDFRFPKFLINALNDNSPGKNANNSEFNSEIIIIVCKSIVNLSLSISNTVELNSSNLLLFGQVFGPLLGQIVILFVNTYKRDKKSRLATQQYLKDSMKACAKFVPSQSLKNNLISFENEWTKLVLCDNSIKTRHRGNDDAANTVNMNSLIGSALVEVARVHFTFVDSFVQTKLYESFIKLFKMGVLQGIKAVTDVIDFAAFRLTGLHGKPFNNKNRSSYAGGGNGRLCPFTSFIFSPSNMELLITNITSVPIHHMSKAHYKYLNSLCLLLNHCLNSAQTARVAQPLIQQYLENLLKIIVSSANESHSVSKKAVLDSFACLIKCTDPMRIFELLLQRIKNAKNNPTMSMCCSICLLQLLTILTDKSYAVCSHTGGKQETLPKLLVQMARELEPMLETCTVSYVYVLKFFKKIITSDLVESSDVMQLILPCVLKLLNSQEYVSRHRIHVKRLLAKMAMRIDQATLWKELPTFVAGLFSAAIKSISKSAHLSGATFAGDSDQESHVENDESDSTLHTLDIFLNGCNVTSNIKTPNLGGTVKPQLKINTNDSIKVNRNKINGNKVKKAIKGKTVGKVKGLGKVKVKNQIAKQPFKYIKLTPKMRYEKNKNETLRKLSLAR